MMACAREIAKQSLRLCDCWNDLRKVEIKPLQNGHNNTTVAWMAAQNGKENEKNAPNKKIYGELFGCICSKKSINQRVAFSTLFANLLSCAFHYSNALWPLTNTFRFTRLPEKIPETTTNTITTDFFFSLCVYATLIIVPPNAKW